MMHTHDTDVVVVGARAAGAATAMLLARAGLDVVVVDRARQGSDTLSTHALMRGAVIQLHRWGLLERIRAAGTPPVRRTTFHLTGGPTVVDIRPQHGIDALYAPRRTVLDPQRRRHRPLRVHRQPAPAQPGRTDLRCGRHRPSRSDDAHPRPLRGRR